MAKSARSDGKPVRESRRKESTGGDSKPIESAVQKNPTTDDRKPIESAVQKKSTSDDSQPIESAVQKKSPSDDSQPIESAVQKKSPSDDSKPVESAVQKKSTSDDSSGDNLSRWISNVLPRSKFQEKDLRALAAFQSMSGEAKLRSARKVIEEMAINATVEPDARIIGAIRESESLLPGYTTLDEPHRSAIQRLITQITTYLRDTTRQRPFNTLMLAAPGAGKSHFIKQLAAKMQADRVQAVTFNMATMQSRDDMAQPIDELRNLKVNDRFPLLFLDEFDSDPSRYAALLPLLWDGELQIGHRDLKLGKAVIVLAGSNPDLPKAMAHSATMRLDGDRGGETFLTGKLVDLLSRINGGVIEIPDLDLRTADRDRRVDKVCVAIALLQRRFGDKLGGTPRSLLRFIAHTKFRYGVRSIAHLVDLIDGRALQENALRAADLGLPMGSELELKGSSLTLHLLDNDQGFGIVNRWNDFSRDSAMIDFGGETVNQLLVLSSAMSTLLKLKRQQKV